MIELKKYEVTESFMYFNGTETIDLIDQIHYGVLDGTEVSLILPYSPGALLYSMTATQVKYYGEIEHTFVDKEVVKEVPVEVVKMITIQDVIGQSVDTITFK